MHFWGKISLIIISLSWCKEASALECYSCLTPVSCLKENETKTVQCDAENSAGTLQALRPLYPDLDNAIAASSNYQCVTVTFKAKDSTGLDFMVKGCMRETKESLCRQESNIQNGELSCKACNVNKCNGAGVFGTSLTLLVVSWFVVQLLK